MAAHVRSCKSTLLRIDAAGACGRGHVGRYPVNCQACWPQMAAQFGCTQLPPDLCAADGTATRGKSPQPHAPPAPASFPTVAPLLHAWGLRACWRAAPVAQPVTRLNLAKGQAGYRGCAAGGLRTRTMLSQCCKTAARTGMTRRGARRPTAARGLQGNPQRATRGSDAARRPRVLRCDGAFERPHIGVRAVARPGRAREDSCASGAPA